MSASHGQLAFREACSKAGMTLLEPIMKVVVTTPEEFVGNVTGDLNRRRGLIVNSEQRGNTRIVEAEVPLRFTAKQGQAGFAHDLPEPIPRVLVRRGSSAPG